MQLTIISCVLTATNQSDATSLAMANNLAAENMLIANAAAADTTVQDSAPDVTYSSVDTGASSAPTYTYDSGSGGGGCSYDSGGCSSGGGCDTSSSSF